MEFVPALTLGILCNALVCLAVWMCFSARTNIDRVVTVVPPIAAFAAAGFEHCIANIYFIPMGLFIKAGAPLSFWTAIGKSASDFPGLTWSDFFFGNLLPVTIAHDGSIMIGAAIGLFICERGRKSFQAKKARSPSPSPRPRSRSRTMLTLRFVVSPDDKASSGEGRNSVATPIHLNIEIADLLAQGIAVDPQQIGGADLVATRGGKRRRQKRIFDLAQNPVIQPGRRQPSSNPEK